MFKKSNFWLAALIIATYILFVLLPDLIYLIRNIVLGITDIKLKYVRMCLHIGNTFDAIIYIFLIPNIRDHLKNKCNKLLSRNQESGNNAVDFGQKESGSSCKVISMAALVNKKENDE